MNQPGESSETPRPDAAFTEMYEAHYASVRAYASACAIASDVDDIVAETFLVAWRRRADVPADWTRGWLIGVARNVVRGRKRASRRAANFVDQLRALTPQSTPGADEAATQELEQLYAAMNSLKASDQEILLLAGPYEMTLEEVGLALNITANAAGVRVHRARERLRNVFEKQAKAGGEAA